MMRQLVGAAIEFGIAQLLLLVEHGDGFGSLLDLIFEQFMEQPFRRIGGLCRVELFQQPVTFIRFNLASIDLRATYRRNKGIALGRQQRQLANRTTRLCYDAGQQDGVMCRHSFDCRMHEQIGAVLKDATQIRSCIHDFEGQVKLSFLLTQFIGFEDEIFPSHAP